MSARRIRGLRIISPGGLGKPVQKEDSYLYVLLVRIYVKVVMKRHRKILDTCNKIEMNVKWRGEYKKRVVKMQNKPIWKIVGLAIALVMVVSGIVFGAGPVIHQIA